MKRDTILVMADPGLAQLVMLEPLRAQAEILVGSSTNAFAKVAAEATIILNWSGSPAMFREVFCMCPKLRWVHTRSAGLERSLFPELIESAVPLTNGTGVFSASLGEFVLAAILYFAIEDVQGSRGTNGRSVGRF